VKLFTVEKTHVLITGPFLHLLTKPVFSVGQISPCSLCDNSLIGECGWLVCCLLCDVMLYLVARQLLTVCAVLTSASSQSLT